MRTALLRVLKNWINDVLSNFNIYYKDKTKMLGEIFMLLVFIKREKKKGKIKRPSIQNLLIGCL